MNNLTGNEKQIEFAKILIQECAESIDKTLKDYSDLNVEMTNNSAFKKYSLVREAIKNLQEDKCGKVFAGKIITNFRTKDWYKKRFVSYVLSNFLNMFHVNQ